MKGKQWAQKQLYGQFIRQTTGKSSEYRRGQLKKGCNKNNNSNNNSGNNNNNNNNMVVIIMACIDYKKAYDMVLHSWIRECLDLFRVAENVKSLLVNSMEKWKVMLCSGNSELSEFEIK